MKQALLLAQGFADLAHGSGSKSHMSDRFKDLVDAIFPFAVQHRGETDKKMKEFMDKEIAKGPIKFEPIQNNLFKSAVKKMSLPDDFRKKLEERKKRLP